MFKNYKVLVLVVSAAILTFILFKLNYFSHLNFSYVNSQRGKLIEFTQMHPYLSRIYFFSFYLMLASLSIPGALFLALLSPSLFNLAESFILVCLASSLGSVVSLLIFRFFLKDWAKQVFKKQIQKYKKQITENQKSFLFSLRLIPIFPFSWVSILYSVTDIKIRDYFWITVLGMSPGICVNLYAGLQLSSIQTFDDFYSAKVIFAFVLMATFPLILKPFVKFS